MKATYKGRQYDVEYIGETRFGSRAKLAYPDDPDKTFWVDADAIEIDEPRRSLPQRKEALEELRRRRAKKKT